MARRLDQFNSRDVQLAQQAAGVLIPDGSGRLVRNGVIVSAEDAARSSMDRARNSALSMQTAAFSVPQQALAREMDRIGTFASPAPQPQFGGFSQGQADAINNITGSRQPRRTLSGQVMPDATGASVNDFAPADFQGALATLRDARADVGDSKNYSDTRLDEIARQPGGAQRIINEATTVLPILRQRRSLGQQQDYVTGLNKNAAAIGQQITDVEARITAEPTITPAEKMAYAQMLINETKDPTSGVATLDKASAVIQAEQILSETKRREWEAANRNTLTVRDQLRRQQQEAGAQVQEFAKRGIFPQDATASVIGAGASTAALGGSFGPVGDISPSDIVQARIAAGNNAISAADNGEQFTNRGGAQNVSSAQSWLPAGSIAYQNRAGQYIVNGQPFENETAAANYFRAQQAIPEAQAANLFLAGLNTANDERIAANTLADATTLAAQQAAVAQQTGFNRPNINGVPFVRQGSNETPLYVDVPVGGDGTLRRDLSTAASALALPVTAPVAAVRRALANAAVSPEQSAIDLAFTREQARRRREGLPLLPFPDQGRRSFSGFN